MSAFLSSRIALSIRSTTPPTIDRGDVGVPLNSVFGTANDAGAFFPSSLTRATPSVALAFPTSRAMVRETAMGKYCNLPIGPDRRQWTTGGARRQSSAYGKGAYSFLSKPWVFPSCENEADSLFSDALQTLAARRVAPAAKRRRGPSALLATRAKMPPSSRTMPRSSQSTLISATPSTPTETRFDSASRSSSTVLPTTTFQPTCRQPSYQPQRTELPPEPTSGLQEWARRKDRHSEQRQVRQRWKRPGAEDSSEQRHEASLGLQMAGWKAMS